MKKIETLVICIVCVFLLSGCVSTIKKGGDIEQYGINIHIPRVLSPDIEHSGNYYVWINNTNNFSVRIKQVWIGHAEITMWIKEFVANESVYQIYNSQYGWHIYTMDGIEVGWIE
jgi:hypothetical protein